VADCSDNDDELSGCGAWVLGIKSKFQILKGTRPDLLKVLGEFLRGRTRTFVLMYERLTPLRLPAYECDVHFKTAYCCRMFTHCLA
jgi:hypothetical protein